MSHDSIEGWRPAALGDVFDVNWGDTSITKSSYSDNGYVAYSASGPDGFIPSFQHDADGVVVSAIGAGSGRCFLASGKWTAIKNTLTVLKKPTSDYSIEFAFQLLNDPRRWPVEGGAQPFIGLKKARAATFQWPPPAEQRRIAEILSSVDEAIQATQAVIEQTRTVKVGVLQRLLTRGIGHTSFRCTEVGELPASWSVVPLQTVADVRTGVAKGKKDLVDPVELPYLRVANVQDGHLDLTEVKTISIARAHIARYSLSAGDVLMTEGGDYDKLGRGDVWQGQITPCLHQNHVFAVRPDQRVLNSDFLAALTSSRYGKAYFMHCAKRSTNLASINSTQVRGFPVILPERQEQEEIVMRLRSFSEAICRSEQNLASLQSMKEALMSDLLTGNIRVAGHLAMAAE